jgi:endonuclease/exonuclease/phosphatase family metal-dependent hydrolase
MSNDLSEKKINQYTIAFYNLENLFDIKDDPKKLDDDFTEHSERKWNKKRFQKKIKNLGRVIQQIGYQEVLHPPVLVGVAEIENAFVLRKLVESKFLKKKEYDIVHFDSPDERGIDTALIYRKEYFKVIEKKAISVYLQNEFGERDFTRDILYVKGILENEVVHILVNHWPSRRAAAVETSYKRVAAAKKNKEIIAEINKVDPNAKIIIMGDFNDDPTSESIRKLVGFDLYNPMELLHTKYAGSTTYRGSWNLFDQIILTNNFLQQHGNSFRFKEAKIFNAKSLKEYKGRNKGNPFRTFIGRKYIGGISDHFPVYSVFSVHSNE